MVLEKLMGKTMITLITMLIVFFPSPTTNSTFIAMKDGRISVITFHSLEDKIVKNIFKEYSTPQDLPPGLPIVPVEYQPDIKLVNRKPIVASKEELEVNNRSRSAKLRIIEKITPERVV